MKKYDNFKQALNNLKAIYEYTEPYNKVVLTGLTGLFEICFELSWKLIKEVLENSGFSQGKTGSPKQVLKTAYAAGIIKNEELWLDALISRNNASHRYDEIFALDIINKTKNEYYKMFCELDNELSDGWL